ncbi:MAG: toxin-antitoxin system YwqK family antitoxin [Flavobacteriales bacterium]|nr:toxin-antitoxin system YwqK family antitoxin [Flavobacteriales bacterium]
MHRSTSLSIALVVVLTSTGLAQPPAPAPNATDPQGRKQGDWVRLWAGSDQVRYTGRFDNDRPIGRFTYYSTDGKVESIVDHYPGSNAAHGRHFHHNGELMAEGRYVGEQKDSTWNYYDEDGRLRATEQYVNGEQDGLQTTYFENGSPAETVRFQKGVQNGEHIQYFANGQVRHHAQYANGEPEGTMTWYYPDGKREIEGRMVNGLRDGAWIYFNQDGTVQLQTLYEQGSSVREKRENGTFTDRYDDDRPKRQETYRKGLLEGPFTEWYDNGTFTEEPMPTDPMLGQVDRSDDMQRMLKGQTTKREGSYLHGELHGTVKYYDENGGLVRTEEYANGQLISSRP